MITTPNGEHLEVLICWKDIARYMGKGVRTVQRWEQQFGLPVQRPLGAVHKSSVIAHPHDLSAWVETRWTDKGKQASQDSSGATETAKITMTNLPAASLSAEIHKARELRDAHLALTHEISAAIQNLVRSCEFAVKQPPRQNSNKLSSTSAPRTRRQRTCGSLVRQQMSV